MPDPKSASRISTEPSVARSRGFDLEELPEGTIEVPNLLAGMVTNMPRNETPPNSAEVIKNGRVRGNWCGRRGGYHEVVPKTDGGRVLHLLLYHSVGNTHIVKITQDAIYATAHAEGWRTILAEEAIAINDLEGTIDSLTGTIDDLSQTAELVDAPVQFDHAQLIDRLYLATVSSRLIEVDFEQETWKRIEGSPNARFVESFAERIIVGNVREKIGGAGPSRIVWSGRLEPENWDATEDISAGQVDLSSSPSDAGDRIAGLFTISDALVILRERSIWHATRNPVAENPFRFRQVVGDHGCDLPRTAVKVGQAAVRTEFSSGQAGNQIIFADYRTKGVWSYRPGARPQRISRQIEDQLYQDLESLIWAEAAYDPFKQEYHLGLATDEQNPDVLTKVWIYSLQHNAWSYDEGEYTALGSLLTRSDITQIDELQGITNDLAGTIDSLSPEKIDTPGAMRGTSTGEVLYEKAGEVEDYDGVSFQFLYRSPNFGSLQRRRQFQRLVAQMECVTEGDLTFEISNDRTNWRRAITKTIPEGDREKMGVRNQNLSGDDLWVRFRTETAGVRLFNYWLKILEKGLHRND